jgi:hypothetical protein
MELNYARNSKYFNTKYGKLFTIGFIVGIILIAVGLLGEDSSSYLVGGIVVLAITIALLVIVSKTIPSDKEIDQQLSIVVDQLSGLALNKHGISEDQVQKVPPLILGGYISELLGNDVKNLALLVAGKVGGEFGSALAEMGIKAIEDGTISGIKYKKGRDGITRSSAAMYTIFLFSENQVFVYTLEFSLIAPEKKEASQEYFYRDIVSISTETAKSGSHVFTIKISGGDSEKIPYGKEEASDIQQKINTFRQLIREKKNV